MRRFRSYFLKSNTIIKDTFYNSSQNPVTEITYGGDNKISRFIFDIDLDPLINKINSGFINQENIISHNLVMTNTIKFSPKYVGGNTYNSNIERTSSFVLDVFNINEEWDEGSGYDFCLLDNMNNCKEAPSNWFNRKTNESWDCYGVYCTGNTETVLTSQSFDKGNENIYVDLTDYIDDRLFDENNTSKGLGIKFTNDLEELKTIKIQSVGFHTNNTHTFFEPYIETILNDEIIDDRNYFYQDRDNTLCLEINENIDKNDIVINQVIIYDYLGSIFKIIESKDIKYLGRNIYSIQLNISSEKYPDAVLFRDEWDITIKNKSTKKIDKFYINSNENYYFLNSNEINSSNYHFFFWNINEKEKIKRGDVRKVKLVIKELYGNKLSLTPLNIQYRLYSKINNKNEIDIIPFTNTDRIKKTHEFIIDTSWLIPQDYYIDVRVINGNSFSKSKETLSFTVESVDVIKKHKKKNSGTHSNNSCSNNYN